MRVIAGRARSIPLVTPAGMDTRPTQDRIKETLFNMIHQDLPGCVFVDLFSGSGGIGIEALSRGAKKCFFADNSPEAIRCITANVRKCRLEEESIILKQDCEAAITSIHEKVDYIFMDPPYHKEWERIILQKLASSDILRESTVIIVEASLQTDLPYIGELGYEILKEKCYKTNKHVFLRYIAGQEK